MINIYDKKYLIKILKVLLKIDDIEIMKYTIESIIEELEENNKISHS
jgi:hypothetical protein